jgi:hypothetical protein
VGDADPDKDLPIDHNNQIGHLSKRKNSLRGEDNRRLLVGKHQGFVKGQKDIELCIKPAKTVISRPDQQCIGAFLKEEKP